jgi:dimethylaniline monooxygenase (N-oxide forming)
MSAVQKRLAIVGGGSSGLVTLKFALDELTDWDIVCFEKSDCLTGCWGRPYPGFVSTSTKYTTQFASFPLFAATVNPDGGLSREEFFREGEYGQYLEQFAERFGLRKHSELNTTVEQVKRGAEGCGWDLSIRSEGRETAQLVHFDAVVLCTGLAAQPKRVESNLPALSVAELSSPSGLGHVQGKRIVVIGGGESAVDYAVRLSRPELGNRVFLSLYTGIRVSPRYHPIRGVPSDFLRNRLMLSIHEDLRNWIGQRFVEARINYQEVFERWFPPKTSRASGVLDVDEQQVAQLRKHWAFMLTKAAKDDLFNMFHNKSDGFLDAVARGAIQIVGPPVDRNYSKCKSFESTDSVEVDAELLVPAIGYRSTLESISDGQLRVRDFYLGCSHVQYDDLFLVGFARPIIGNIPTISEVQAKYIVGLLSGRVSRKLDIAKSHQLNAENNGKRFAKLNLDAIYPVEMFPYCDKLSRLMNCYPSIEKIGSMLAWCREQLTPATTLHYFARDAESGKSFAKSQVYMPPLFIGLLLMLKPIDWVYRIAQRMRFGNQSEIE